MYNDNFQLLTCQLNGVEIKIPGNTGRAIFNAHFYFFYTFNFFNLIFNAVNIKFIFHSSDMEEICVTKKDPLTVGGSGGYPPVPTRHE